MALDRHFFDFVRSDISRRHYYGEGEVRSLLDRIERETDALYAENARLRAQLENMERAENLTDIDILSQKIVDKARSDAEDILNAARSSRDDMQQAMVDSVRLFIETLRRQQQENVDTINSAWQSFLSNLNTDDGDIPPSQAKKAPNELKDLQSRVEAIADQLRQIDQK